METEERAIDPLAGGVLNQGHQCGMLWGAALATGAEAFRRHGDTDEAIAVAITATQHIVESFLNRTDTVNCREIIGIDISKTLGLVKFILQSTFQGAANNTCFHLAEAWAPEAIRASSEGLEAEPTACTERPVSCASEVVRKMGGSREEQVMVAGFAGGLGLSGYGCGALSAAIWMKTLDWCKAHPGKTSLFFRNPEAKRILKAFRAETGSALLCREIAGESFDTMDDHTTYIRNGGCGRLMEVLATA